MYYLYRMANFLDLPDEILEKIWNMVLKENEKELMAWYFFQWKQMVIYQVGGYFKICF